MPGSRAETLLCLMIRGIGPAYAKKLVRAFGEKVFDVIEATPDRLREVDGIGPVRAASILAAWAEQKAVREIMVFLHSHGVGTARAVRIFKTYVATHAPQQKICLALSSELPVNPSGENVHRSAILVVAGVDYELIIRGQMRRGR